MKKNVNQFLMKLKTIDQIIYSLDIFKAPFFFHFSHNRKFFTTPLGFLFSLLIYGVILYYFINSDMIKRTNPTVLSQIIPQLSSPAIPLNSSSFNFTIGLMSEDMKTEDLDPSIVKVRIFGMEYIPDPVTKKKTLKYTELFFHHCTAEESNSDKYLAQIGIRMTYCMNQYNWTLKGGMFDLYISQLLIQLVLCNNETSNGTCKDTETIKKFIQNKYFGLYYKDYIVDFNEYENPFNAYPHVETLLLSTETKSKKDISFRQGKLYQDDSFLLSSKNEMSYFSRDDALLSTATRNENDSTAIAQFIFQSAMNIEESTRIYQKLPDVLAKITGTAKVLVLMGVFITSVYNTICINLYLMVRLFGEGLKEKTNKPKTKNPATIQRNLIELSPKKPELEKEIKKNENFNHNNKKLVYIDRKNIEDESVRSEQCDLPIKTENKRELNLKYIRVSHYFIMKIKQFLECKMNTKEVFLLEAEKKLEYFLNIKFMLRKLRNVERSKYFPSTQLEYNNEKEKDLIFSSDKKNEKEVIQKNISNISCDAQR